MPWFQEVELQCKDVEAKLQEAVARAEALDAENSANSEQVKDLEEEMLQLTRAHEQEVQQLKLEHAAAADKVLDDAIDSLKQQLRFVHV